MDLLQTEENCYEAVDAMDYEALVEAISGSRRFGRAPGIECSRAMLELLGSPQRDLSFVHIAGTNGKGSVAAFLSRICQEAGIEAGLFTSPHLQDFTERIRIGQEQIPKEKALELGRVVWKANHRLMAATGSNLTMFDYCLAMAFLYYKERKVPLVILETGMGGRLDSTNCIPAPLVSVITGIGLEHTQYLGNTIREIAGEKAGILKLGTQAVLMDQSREALDVLTGQCEKLGIHYVVSTAVDEHGYYANAYYEIGMLGGYQRKNAAAAIEAATLLNRRGFDIPLQALQDGIKNARWPGRMELVSRRPWVLLDGAHNVHGMQALTDSLRELWGGEQFIFFMGVMADKDYGAMIDQVLPLAKEIYTLTPASDRALPAEQLCQQIRRRGGAAKALDIAQARTLIRGMDAGEKCVIFGSLYLIGELRRLLRS
jgi:dihydrofolate synthase/folylpolyglutamate synthase